MQCLLVGLSLDGPLLLVWSLSLHVGEVCSSIGQSLGQVVIFLIGPSVGQSVCWLSVSWSVGLSVC